MYSSLHSPMVSPEEYEETCRRRFTQGNIQCERIITYQVTVKHASNLSRNDKRQVRRQSSLFYWDPASKDYYIAWIIRPQAVRETFCIVTVNGLKILFYIITWMI